MVLVEARADGAVVAVAEVWVAVVAVAGAVARRARSEREGWTESRNKSRTVVTVIILLSPQERVARLAREAWEESTPALGS